MNKLIAEFQLKYPELVQKMKDSCHHYSETKLNPYHYEGDIWTHTNLVCLEARNRGLSRELQIACLLHDIGKPACRRSNNETERVNFYGHEPYSAFMSIDIMRDFGLSNEEIIHNFQLISIHTEPFKLTNEALLSRYIYNMKLLEDLGNSRM